MLRGFGGVSSYRRRRLGMSGGNVRRVAAIRRTGVMTATAAATAAAATTARRTTRLLYNE